MTTAQSPVSRLKRQAERIAMTLKAVERGDVNALRSDVGGKLQASRGRSSITFGVAMDDKFLNIEMTWVAIRDTTEAGIAEYILQQMRDAREKIQ